ncbi:MAG: oligoribonuclease [Kofleriaceae bacterium]|nr:oligoribonuclease [Kofleriaceae bacterium]
MDNVSDRLVWLDMEMTGLDPIACVPIEIAVIITDGELNEISGACYEVVIHQPDDALANMPEIVVEMHTENGLLKRVRESSNTLEDADREVAALVAAHCEAGKAMLAGNTIRQERRFIRRYFPQLERTLHYRQVDVSSFKEMVRRWYGADAVFNKATSHTAMSDIRHSIEEMQYYRKHQFR